MLGEVEKAGRSEPRLVDKKSDQQYDELSSQENTKQGLKTSKMEGNRKEAAEER